SEAAQRRGTNLAAERQQFLLQRVLARVFTTNPDGWLLKGGQAMLARWPDARSTGDIDLVGAPDSTRATRVADYTRALQRDLGDHLTFKQIGDSPLLPDGTGARLTHLAYLGDKKYGTVQVDLLPRNGRPTFAGPELVPFPEHIMSTGVAGENPQLRLISLTDSLAHKISGMYTHGKKTAETKCADCLPLAGGMWCCRSGNRVQDLVDTAMIATRWSGDAEAFQTFLRGEFSRRITEGEPLRVPNKFLISNPEWIARYQEYAAATPGLPFRTFREANPVVSTFLDPLLNRARTASGTWDPTALRWTGSDSPSPARPARTTPVLVHRVLVVAHASGREARRGGLPVASGELTKALAELPGVEVTLLTIGETESHGRATVVSVPADRSFPSARTQLRDLARIGRPESFPGMPPVNSDFFNVVIGHSRFSGTEAMNIRNLWYPSARLVHVMHMPVERYGEIQGWPERGRSYAENEAKVVRDAELVVGVGPLLVDVGHPMADGAYPMPSFHEMISGVELLGRVDGPPPGKTFNLLFS
ncbi:MAG: nucleotidyl transferase AbiEii/AbiGii toxin family protein, partial [Pseudonocardia sp.]